jgi:hypothetical protein
MRPEDVLFDHPLTNPADVLEVAADNIERLGWIQDHSYLPDRGVCALGAIDMSLELLFQGLNGPHIQTKSITSARPLRDEALVILANYLDREGQLPANYIADLQTNLRRYQLPFVLKNYAAAIVVTFNDDPERVAEDVVMAMRKAALGAREQVTE